MPSETFFNLPLHKQERIDLILINIFSNNELANVKVSQIISEMQMSRGAFYKYFKDLADAHNYIIQKASANIHDEIFQKIIQHDKELFIGLRSFVKEFSQLSTDDLLYRYFILLNVTPNQQLTEMPCPDNKDVWLEILDKLQIEFQSLKEKISYLIFIMNNLISLLKSAIKRHWDEQESLKQFDYFVSWLK